MFTLLIPEITEHFSSAESLSLIKNGPTGSEWSRRRLGNRHLYQKTSFYSAGEVNSHQCEGNNEVGVIREQKCFSFHRCFQIQNKEWRLCKLDSTGFRRCLLSVQRETGWYRLMGTVRSSSRILLCKCVPRVERLPML